jgi:aspartate-semialdehyde dehydrogenase
MSSLYSTVATLAPLFDRERAEKVDTYTYNPVYGPTEYNIDPLLEQITMSDRISRYNMANINPNTGANMAFGL